jgi:hypothetical protein
MWNRISLTQALQAFLAGKTVKVVDFTAETVLPLSEVLERFEKGVGFFAEASEPLVDVTRGTVTIEENGDIHITRARPVDTVHGLVEDCAAPDPEQNDTEEGQKVEYKAKNRNNKTVEDVEREYQSRKITDIGKLKACRAAGWTLKKLADEFQCSTQTVRNTLTREGIE